MRRMTEEGGREVVRRRMEMKEGEKWMERNEGGVVRRIERGSEEEGGER